MLSISIRSRTWRLIVLLGWCCSTELNAFVETNFLKTSANNIQNSTKGLEDTKAIVNPFRRIRFNEDAFKTLPELIRSNGFPVEIHKVTSDDGYITSLIRIPMGKIRSKESFPKKVVFLQHGIVVDAASWILNSVDSALAYRLADLGNVDVWMGNARGTDLSLGHVSLNDKNYRYWNFTFHEIGVFDLPRIIDYILDLTSQPDMYYVGHSMGCAELAVTLSTFPEYNSKIRTFIALAPAVFIGNASSKVSRLAPELVKVSQAIHDSLLLSPAIPPPLLAFSGYVGCLCAPPLIFRYICYALVESFFGYDTQETNYEMSAEITSQGFSSTSTKSVFHLLQLVESGKFRQYDYQDKNYQMYGQSTPPAYDLSKVTVPTVAYCGSRDNLVPCADVDKFVSALPNVKEYRKINWPRFTHIDFMYALNINKLLNDRIIEIIDKDIYYKKST